ncbi:MAG: SBBP repeat-containing protein [Bacteroidia bacterium]
MKKVFTILAFILVCSVFRSYSQAPNWSWEYNPDGTSYDAATDIAADARGNIYQCGYYGSTLDFSGTVLTNPFPATHDSFLAKYDPSGNVLWAQSWGGNNEDIAFSVATDASGNALVAGFFFSPTITFGSVTLTNSGDYDVFLVKYDPSGMVLWARSAGRIADDFARGIATDDQNNVYVTGTFLSPTIDFGPITLTNTDPAINTSDVFLVKYDSAGTVLWARRAGGDSSDYVRALDIDNYGNPLIAGTYLSPQLNLGSDTLVNQGYDDSYLAKFDTAGSAVWARGIGGNDYENITGLATDPFGNSYVSGGFGTLSLLIGSTTLTNTSPGNYNTMLVKFDSAGSVLWAKEGDGTGNDFGVDVAADSQGNPYLTGFYNSSVLSFGTFSLTNMGLYDCFLTKYDTSGVESWAKSAGDIDVDYAQSVCTDLYGNAYITGYFRSPTLDFSGTLVNGGGDDPFLAKAGAVGIGIAETGPKEEMKIFPNPAKNIVTVSVKEAGRCDLLILNIVGERVLGSEITSERTEIDLSDFSPGVYFFELNSRNGRSVKKIIKE